MRAAESASRSRSRALSFLIDINALADHDRTIKRCRGIARRAILRDQAAAATDLWRKKRERGFATRSERAPEEAAVGSRASVHVSAAK